MTPRDKNLIFWWSLVVVVGAAFWTLLYLFAREWSWRLVGILALLIFIAAVVITEVRYSRRNLMVPRNRSRILDDERSSIYQSRKANQR